MGGPHSDTGKSLTDMSLKKLFLLLFFTLLWWISMWTLVEELIHWMAGGSKRRRIFIYLAIVAGLLILMAADPEALAQM